MARPKVNRKNIGLYGVFLVDLTDEEYPTDARDEAKRGVMQVVDYDDDTDSAYCLLFCGTVNDGDYNSAVKMVETESPSAGFGFIASSLRFQEIQYAGAVRPSLHYRPPAFMVNGNLVHDFSGSLEETIAEDESPMPPYQDDSTLGLLIDALRHLNQLPNDFDATDLEAYPPKIPLRKYFSEDVVGAKLAALDKAAGFNAPEVDERAD